MKLKKGLITDIFLNYQEEKKYVGKAVLLMKNNNKATLPPMSFVSEEENKKKEKINSYLLTTPIIEGESDGTDYKVKPIKLKYTLYTWEYWFVEFIDETSYPMNFKKWMKIRVPLGHYTSMKELSSLTKVSGKMTNQ